MKSSKIIATLIALAALLWIGSGFLNKPSPPQATEQNRLTATEKLTEVRVRDMKAALYTDEITITGRSQASRSVELKAETDGLLDKIQKEEGSRVLENDILAELELGDKQARVKESAQRVEQRKIEYEAARKLENKGFNSKVRLAQASADLESARAALKQTQIKLDKTKIKAPFDGIISEQYVDLGDYLAIGDSLFTIVDLDPLEFSGFLSERHIQDIKTGQEADAEFLDGQTLKGHISYISPAANPQTRTFRITISVPNPDFAIKDGLTVKLHMPVKEKKAHKISPSILSLNGEGQIGVKLLDDHDKVRFIPVNILANTPEAMWVTGPPDTARIITVGQDFVIEGQHVKPVPSQGDGLL